MLLGEAAIVSLIILFFNIIVKSVIYLIRIASREAFFWDYAPPRTAQQIDQLHIHMERRQRRSRPGRDGAQDTSLYAPVLLRLFCICSARSFLV